MDQEGQLAAQPAEPRVVSLACGSSHSLALLATPAGSMVLSWGRGEDGQLGHGDAEERRRPQAVLTLLHRGVNDLQCGAEYSVAASGTEKQLFSWGWGDFGRLGTGDCRDVFIPAPLPALSGRVVASVACGDTHTVVATDSGELFSFGRNQNGQLGLGSIQDTLSPQPVTALQGKRVVRVACGAEHSVCSTDEGEVFGWGWGRYGNVGDGETQDRHTPTKAKGLEGVKVAQVACGWRHSIAVDEAGSMYTWGWNSYGQLGHGDRIDQYIPKRVEALRQQRVALVTGGWRHTLAADGEGRVWAAGWGKFGQCGVGTNEDVVTPQQVQALAGQRVVLLESGWKHSLAVTDTGRFYAWGRNVNGQLGTGGTQDSNVPVEILALSVGSINLDAFTQEARPVGVQGVAPSDRYAVVPDSAPPSNEAGGTLQPSSAAAVPEPNKRQKV
ncbi:ultraviolet-B receptor UVR8 [Micractinium conductrix]|uniref:Ultraviolet-B receptor UVR8 n=1 Tax=Micractinium conductrix TaxID=554055 RepID=A0A2P6VDN6_9CHLO|nr:ultraviolet-B receptor UVR8 [Micractinium conductrix]|eukprot:PSC72205.1 ultraviolet-B receptor UVR8 [Micractinium conductrix]